MYVEFFKHNLNDEDIERVDQVLRSIFLTNAKMTKRFESEMAEFLKVPQAIGVSSCTAALHLSLQAFGVGPGDEVITTPLSFVATANAILHVGATPVFVDVEPETGNLNCELVEAAITERTKAIIPVHLYGLMVDMKRLRQIANQHKLVIIEDAAHCLEGRRDGIQPGQLGDAACFSFYATKNITSGEGGAIVCQRPDIAEKLFALRLHGINKDASDRYTRLYQHYDMTDLGWKYNMFDIQAALLVGQLKRVEGYREQREAICQRYETELRYPGIGLLSVPEQAHSARHLFTILVERRDQFLIALQEKGVGVAVNYRAIPRHSFYRKQYPDLAGRFPIADSIGERTLSLPLYPKMTDAEQSYVIQSVKEIADQLR